MLKVMYKFLEILLIASFCTFTFGDLATSINTLLSEQSKDETIGLYVENIQTATVLYSHNGNLPMTPASTAKAFTAAAAFLSLGPNFHYVTTLSTNGKIAETLNGNIYIHFSGDPTLSSIDLDTMIRQLRLHGIRSIQGNVILDETVFAGPVYGAGWGATDYENCYAAPITGAIINNDCSRFGVIRDPNFYAEQTVRYALIHAGIRLHGQILEGQTPSNTTLLAVHYSSSLQTILDFMLKYSDDVYANAIFKTMGEDYFHTGSYTSGSLALHAILVGHFGTLFGYPQLKDGSGLSTENRISPQQLVALYRYMYDDLRLREPFIQSLAISGQSGTLVFRLNDPLLRGHVFAKTGTFYHDRGGVSNLAGYLLLPSYPPIAFAIMINNDQGDENQAIILQDKIVRLIAASIVSGNQTPTLSSIAKTSPASSKRLYHYQNHYSYQQ